MTFSWRVSLFCALFVLPSVAYASAVDNATNSGPTYLRTLAPNATANSAEAMVFNPAGLTSLDEGFYINLSSQTMLLYHKHELDNEVYSARDVIKSIPAAYFVYAGKRFATFLGLHLVGGGGGVHYKDGSASIGRGYDISLAAAHAALTLGGTYAFTDWLSLALGARGIYAGSSIRVLDPQGNVFADVEDRASGVGAVFGLNIKPLQTLVFSLRYDSEVNLNFKQKKGEGPFASSVLPSGQRRRDFPSLLGLGAQVAVLPGMRVLGAFNYYFNRQADWDGLEKKHDNGYEISAGAEVDINPSLLLSGGALYGSPGPKRKGYAVEAPSLDNVSVAVGGLYRLTGAVNLECGFVGSFGQPATGAHPLTDVDIRLSQKIVWVFSAGVQVRLG